MKTNYKWKPRFVIYFIIHLGRSLPWWKRVRSCMLAPWTTKLNAMPPHLWGIIWILGLPAITRRLWSIFNPWSALQSWWSLFILRTSYSSELVTNRCLTLILLSVMSSYKYFEKQVFMPHVLWLKLKKGSAKSCLLPRFWSLGSSKHIPESECFIHCCNLQMSHWNQPGS